MAQDGSCAILGSGTCLFIRSPTAVEKKDAAPALRHSAGPAGHTAEPYRAFRRDVYQLGSV